MLYLKDAFTDFLLHCQYEKTLSQKTLKFYGIDLHQFEAFLLRNNFQTVLNDIDKNILRAYLQALSGFKPKTIKRKLATLKAFFNYMEFEDQIVVNPFRKVRIKIKEPVRLPTVMSISEVQKILKVAYSKLNTSASRSEYSRIESLRNVAIVELLFATGVRVSEVSNLKEGDVDLKVGFIKVKGKGNKERMIQVCNKETLYVLKQYAECLKNRRQVVNEFFFKNRLNKRLSEQSIRLTIKKFAQAALPEKRITPHIFRHSFATLLLEEDVDIKYIQHLLGHSSIMTTQIYTHVNKKKQRSILRHKHPRENFKMQAIQLSE